MRVFVQVGGQLNPGISELWVTVDVILRGMCHSVVLC